MHVCMYVCGTRTWCLQDMLAGGDRAVRERDAIIGAIFGNSTDFNFEKWHDRAQRASVGLVLTHPCATEVAGLADSWATATSST